MKPVLLNLPAALLIALFGYTALHKLTDLPSFLQALSAMPLLRSAPVFFGYAVPVAECLTAALLFVPATRRAGCWMSLSLLLAFTTYLTAAILSGIDLPCACGGVIRTLSWTEHLVLNICLIALALIGLTRRSRKPVNRVGNIPVTSKSF